LLLEYVKVTSGVVQFIPVLVGRSGTVVYLGDDVTRGQAQLFVDERYLPMATTGQSPPNFSPMRQSTSKAVFDRFGISSSRGVETPVEFIERILFLAEAHADGPVGVADAFIRFLGRGRGISSFEHG